MRRDFIRVSPGEDLTAVLRLMGMARVRALPVVQEGRLAGMVRHADLARAALERGREEGGSLAGSIAPYVRIAETVSPETTLREAASRMLSQGLPCLAAVDGLARVVGLLTEGDLLRAAYQVLGRL